MSAPTTHFRLGHADGSGFCDATQYDSKVNAEAQGAAVIVAPGGPSRCLIYQLVAAVEVSTVANDAISP